VNNWFLMNGFSIGIGDGIANEATMSQVEQIIKRSKGACAPAAGVGVGGDIPVPAHWPTWGGVGGQKRSRAS
jgi:hypothetical protein